MHTYRFSKREAERAGWRLLEEQKPAWDIVTINPPIVIGPWLPGYNRPNESSMIIKEWIAGTLPSAESRV